MVDKSAYAILTKVDKMLESLKLYSITTEDDTAVELYDRLLKAVEPVRQIFIGKMGDVKLYEEEYYKYLSDLEPVYLKCESVLAKVDSYGYTQVVMDRNYVRRVIGELFTSKGAILAISSELPKGYVEIFVRLKEELKDITFELSSEESQAIALVKGLMT